MIVLNPIRWKRTLICTFILSITFLLVSLIFLLQEVENDTLPFDKDELNTLNADKFLYLEDVFKQKVPDINHLRYHQKSAIPCNSKTTPTLLAFIHSAPTHFLHRKAIRNTWGFFSDGFTIRTVFVVGQPTQDRIWQRILQEADSYGDIVLVHMPDSYSNLTLKHLVGLHWTLKNCPDVPYVLKSDDDVYINMYRVENVIMSNLPLNTIACRVVPAGSVPKRSGKWRVTRNDYPFDDYPEYCSGLAYFSRPSVLKRILNSALSGKVPYLWIDDVFMTGFSTEKIGVKRMDLSVWFARTDEQIMNWLNNDKIITPLQWMVADISPVYWPAVATALWNKTMKTHKIKQ